MAGTASADKQDAGHSVLAGVGEDINQALRDTLLAYSDWQDASDPKQRKERQAHLDHILDHMQADDWDDMKSLVGLMDANVMIGLMHYSAKRADEDLRDRIATMTPEKDPTQPHSKQKLPKRDRAR